MSTLRFDPNSAGSWEDGIYGLPFNADESKAVVIPVPWEATTSYGGGTAEGPRAVLEASEQVDLYDLELGRIYEPGIHLLPISKEVAGWSREAKALAGKAREGDKKALDQVNKMSTRLNEWVRDQARTWMAKGKLVAVLGGDHSTPFGAFEAAAETFGEFGILHFDAHSDTRKEYQGFTFSHASIMHNALTRIPGVRKLTQVGIRDFCEEEMTFIRSQGKRMEVFFDLDLKADRFSGKAWRETCDRIVASLPEKVWISFDIDGLDPSFCPNTGTPVPGGLHYNEALFLIRTLAQSGRKIIGFDLNEVAPGEDEWDANVGARILYKLLGWALSAFPNR